MNKTIFYLQANHFFENTEYTSAINYYNEAIGMVESSILFSNRAAAYIKRKWHGDIYAALKDCVTALKLDPNHMKSHFRLAVCLYELGQLEDSIMYLDQFTKKFPSCKYSVAYKVLQEDIVIAKLKKQNDINGNCNNNIYILYCKCNKILMTIHYFIFTTMYRISTTTTMS